MKAMQLWDTKGGVFLTLNQVLFALPHRARSSDWFVSDYIDPAGEEFFEVGYDHDDLLSPIVNTGRSVPGTDLYSIAKSTSQVIWGSFTGHDQGKSEPWIRLDAIDSSFWGCETRDISARQALMKAFRDVRLADR